MVRPVTVRVAGVGASPVIPIDSYVTPFSLAVGCKVEGYVKYSVEHTYDNVFVDGFSPKNASWFDAPNSVLTEATTSAFGGYTSPISAIRLRILAGEGVVVMSVIHGGIYQEDTPIPRAKMAVPDVPVAEEKFVQPSPWWRRVVDWFKIKQ